MTLRQILVILRARFGVALGVFLAVVGLAMGGTLFFDRLYTATATVVVDVKTDPLSTSLYSDENNVSYLGTQVEIASSDRVAQRVVRSLRIDEMPEYQKKFQNSTHGHGDYIAWLGHLIEKQVTIKPTPQSNVIDISVDWKDPKFAASLANAFAQSYIDTNIALKTQMAKEYSKRFEDRAVTLRAALEAKQKALSDFENQTGIVATDDRLDNEITRLNELSTQLVQIQGQRQDSQSRQRQTGREEESIPEVLQNAVVASLKSDLSRAEARLEDLRTTLGTNHPLYRATASEVDGLRERVAVESGKIIASFRSTTRVNEQREAAIMAALDAQKKRILELKHQRDQATDLQNDVTLAQRNLESVSQRLAQSTLESSTEQTNIGLLTAATEPASISSPKYWLVFGIAVGAGLFLGLAIALIMEVSDQRVRSDAEILALIDAPLYGVIATITYPPRELGSGSTLPRLEPSPI